MFANVSTGADKATNTYGSFPLTFDSFFHTLI